jgi:hypothetical protein
MEGAGWLWLFVDVVGVAALGGALIYATMMWRRRRKDPSFKHRQEEAVRENYRQADKDDG